MPRQQKDTIQKKRDLFCPNLFSKLDSPFDVDAKQVTDRSVGQLT